LRIPNFAKVDEEGFLFSIRNNPSEYQCEPPLLMAKERSLSLLEGVSWSFIVEAIKAFDEHGTDVIELPLHSLHV
jgi:hypothetical protein